MNERITGICSMAMRLVLAELSAAYEQQSGNAVSVESVGGVDAARRIEAGEAFDFVVLASQAIDRLADMGRVDPETRIALAQSRVAIAVAAGAPRPAIGNGTAVRDALLAARRVGYSTGPSGRHLARLIERWDMTNTMANRLVEAPPGVPVGALLARGDVDLGFQQLSELMHVPGVDVVGTLPPEIQEVTVFSGAVCATSARPAAARALLSFLASPDTGAIKRRHGMEPN
jgi:molybdate transport system substrate-binding protein